ncbi:pyridoxamine 5'-phosphate oxidase family protein [Pseudonocardia sp. WMMC193]|uniref:pyridoxamine 5'-phosphate oxidase family protein n=1 Tax=Pseudonocardia sp. WMMC193 TaxID=2911965 RepID=UPI001F1CB3A9|nr:pyridoxamine 5'-phosphate oxidase family protein [Pseudonocardia sp. WMMC193]MCF7551234.1 pyridoxamine 5'-phosphate oxidase family protein [Pseudonocardia sp. WMMC193]
MPSWSEVEEQAPELAARARALFEAHRHKTIATLRADGAPRISGIECAFADGELTFGSMPAARKGADLRRDPRFALHSATYDPPENEAEWEGDAKVAGRAVLTSTPSDEADAYRADVTELVVTRLNDTATLLVVESWTPTGGVVRVERE